MEVGLSVSMPFMPQSASPVFVWPTLLTEDQWKSLRNPTLFIVGENEKIYPARKAVSRLRRVAPNVKAAMVSGVGHDLVVKSREIGELVLRFLAEEP